LRFLPSFFVSAATPTYASNLKRFHLKQVSVNQGWNNLFELDNTGGCGTYLWYATSSVAGTAFNNAFRITFDGAKIPQFGGIYGIGVEDLFGYGYGFGSLTPQSLNGDLYLRNRLLGVTRADSLNQTEHGAYINLIMPFSSGIKVEFYAVQALTLWFQIDYLTGSYPSSILGSLAPYTDWTLHAVSKKNVSVNWQQEFSLLDVSGDSGEYQGFALLGLAQHEMTPNGGSETYLEGPYSIYTDETNTPTYMTSGTEDFFDSAYDFAEGTFQTETAGVTVLFPSTLAAWSVRFYRYFDINILPMSATNLRFTWINGFMSWTANQTVTSSSTVLWYMR